MSLAVAANGDLIIKEEIDPQLLQSLFRNYSSGAEAVLELIDNSVDENLQGRRLSIDVNVSAKAVEIVDRGGRGMGAERLNRFFRWGASEKAGHEGKLGRYGQGGKAAMGYLGRSFTLTAKAAGAPETYELVEADWHDRRAGVKTWTPRLVPPPVGLDEGYVAIRITNLLARRVNRDTVRERLGDVYRELLRDGKCVISVNGQPVLPLELPLYEAYPVHKIDTNIGGGLRLRGWFGRLKADMAKHGRRGGMRCTVNGRLIKDGEFFGHPGPTFKQSLNQLIGVMEVPFVPLNMNKTEFDRDSREWVAVEQYMHAALDEIIRELRGAREQDKVTDTDRKRVRDAQDLFEAAIKRLENRELLEQRFSTGAGQKKKEALLSVAEIVVTRKPRSDIGGKHKPATPPPSGSVGLRRRRGRLPWRPWVLGDRTRAAIIKEGDAPVLLINTRYPLYKATNRELWYVLETGALEYAKYDRDAPMSADEYLIEVNEILAEAFAEKS